VKGKKKEGRHEERILSTTREEGGICLMRRKKKCLIKERAKVGNDSVGTNDGSPSAFGKKKKKKERS